MTIPPYSWIHTQLLTTFQLTTESFWTHVGYTPRNFPLTHKKTKFPHLDDWLLELEQARQEALAVHEIARSRMARRINKTFDHFKTGQEVRLDARHLKLGYNKTISTKWEGSFIIEKKVGPVTYQLKLLKTWKIHPTFHAILLLSYCETKVNRPNFKQPPPDFIEGEYEYEVERILKHRKQGRTMAYLILWKGYQPHNDSWELERNLTNAVDLLSQYKKDKGLNSKWRKPSRKWKTSYPGQSVNQNSSLINPLYLPNFDIRHSLEQKFSHLPFLLNYDSHWLQLHLNWHLCSQSHPC